MTDRDRFTLHILPGMPATREGAMRGMRSQEFANDTWTTLSVTIPPTARVRGYYFSTTPPKRKKRKRAVGL